jgi:hypothetical protein
MASVPRPAALSVEQLLEVVDNLSPDDRREFQRRLAARGGQNGSSGADEAALVRAARSRLPADPERRLRKLITRSEPGRLTPKELADYQSLARDAQRIDATRAEALAELARRRGKSVRAVKAGIDREGGTDGA